MKKSISHNNNYVPLALPTDRGKLCKQGIFSRYSSLRCPEASGFVPTDSGRVVTQISSVIMLKVSAWRTQKRLPTRSGHSDAERGKEIWGMLRAIFIGVLLLANLASAQEVGLFRMGGWNGSLKFRYDKDDKISPEISQNRTYNESLILRSKSYIINPDFLFLQWSGNLSLFQDRYLTDLIQRYTGGRLLGHTLTATFFRESTKPLILFWNRNRNVIAMDFSGRKKYDHNNLQATFEMREIWLPFRIEVAQRKLHEIWSRARFRTERDQLRESIRYSARRTEEHYSLDVDYDFLNIRDRIRSTSGFRKHSANFRLQHSFGEDRANTWNNEFRFFNRGGLSDYNNARLNSSLELLHLPSLTGKYDYSISLTRSLGRSLLRNTAYASISHNLYSSLKTNLGAGGSYGTMQDGKSTTTSFSGSVSYIKNVPLSGRLQISFTEGYSINDRQVESIDQEIVHERHAFIGGFPIILNERNIVESSIVVFGEDGSLILEEGEDKDYTVRAIQERIEIQRTPFGRIDEDDIVLVDYQFRTLPSIRYSTNTNVFHSGLSFGGLSFGYSVNRHNQELLAGDVHEIPSLQNIFSKSAYFKLTLRGDNAGISLYAERKNYESRSIDYRSNDLRSAFFLIPWNGLTFSSQFTYSYLEHKSEPLDIEVYALGSELRWRPSSFFLFHGFWKYRIREETNKLDERNSEFGLRLERYWPVISLKLQYEKQRWQLDTRLIDDRRLIIEVERRL